MQYKTNIFKHASFLRWAVLFLMTLALPSCSPAMLGIKSANETCGPLKPLNIFTFNASNWSVEEISLALRAAKLLTLDKDFAECMAAYGDKRAQYEMGMRYLYAFDVEKDEKRARAFMKQAAATIPDRTYVYVPGIQGAAGTVMPVSTGNGQPGFKAAMVMLADMYEKGIGGKKSAKKAAKWRKRAGIN